MKSQDEFKALVEQKIKQQRHARRVRRQQLTAIGASLCMLVLVMSLSLYFLKNPLELPMRPADNITEIQSQIIPENGGSAASQCPNEGATGSTLSGASQLAPESDQPDTSANTPSVPDDSSDGQQSDAANSATTPDGISDSEPPNIDKDGSSAAGSSGTAAMGSLAGTPSVVYGSQATIDPADVTALEYRIYSEGDSYTQKLSANTAAIAKLIRGITAVKSASPVDADESDTTVRMCFYNGEAQMLEVRLTQNKYLVCAFADSSTETVKLTDENYDKIIALLP